LSAIEADLAKFAGANAQVVGVSTDSVFSHQAFQEELGGLSFPLASDRWPYCETAKAYGIFPPAKHTIPFVNDRAVFVVDKEGKIAWSKVYDLGKQPDNLEILYALSRLG
jgi:peroxiredoxin